MRHILLHGHIFKNAGTTLDWSLQRCFGQDFLDHRDDQSMRRGGADCLASLVAEHPGLRALSSHHLSRELPELPQVRLHPLFLVRHPLLRVRSVYDFERRQDATTLGAQMAKQLDFRDYVAWRMRPDVPGTIRNYQTFYLARGSVEGRRPGRNLAGFELALAYVRQAPLVGVVELYDESMALFEHRLRRAFPQIDLAYVRQNSSGAADGTAPPERRLAELLVELGDLAQVVIDQNSYDLALYQAVRGKLLAATARIEDFDQQMTGFRQRCAALRDGPGRR